MQILEGEYLIGNFDRLDDMRYPIMLEKGSYLINSTQNELLVCLDVENQFHERAELSEIEFQFIGLLNSNACGFMENSRFEDLYGEIIDSGANLDSVQLSDYLDERYKTYSFEVSELLLYSLESEGKTVGFLLCSDLDENNESEPKEEAEEILEPSEVSSDFDRKKIYQKKDQLKLYNKKIQKCNQTLSVFEKKQKAYIEEYNEKVEESEKIRKEIKPWGFDSDLWDEMNRLDDEVNYAMKTKNPLTEQELKANRSRRQEIVAIRREKNEKNEKLKVKNGKLNEEIADLKKTSIGKLLEIEEKSEAEIKESREEEKLECEWRKEDLEENVERDKFYLRETEKTKVDRYRWLNTPGYCNTKYMKRDLYIDQQRLETLKNKLTQLRKNFTKESLEEKREIKLTQLEEYNIKVKQLKEEIAVLT